MKVVIVGAGVGGLSTALYLRKKGFEVTVLEKLDSPGGRARSFSKDEFSFDMGPSWYLMPEVFEKFYHEVGEEPPEIVEVNPLFSLYVNDRHEDFTKDYAGMEKYLEDTEFMYSLSMSKFLFKEMKIIDFLDKDIIRNLKKFPIFYSLDNFNRRYFTDDFMQKALGFSAVFLGGSPFEVPAVYAMVNYAIFGKGVYYPKGGFAGLVSKLFNACRRAGVEFKFNYNVDKVNVKDKKVTSVVAGDKVEEGDVFVFNMDYHYADSLLPADMRQNWSRKKFAPSAILAYLGVEGEVNSSHHSIFINGNWEEHFNSIRKGIPPDVNNMSYYVSYRKATDKSLNGDDLVFLIPVSPGLDGVDSRFYINKAIEDFKKKTGSKFDVKFERIYSPADFKTDYNAYKGTAFGISHTLDQTGPFRLPMKNKNLDNLFYVGQYTQPGIGVPMVTISAMIVAEKIESEKHVVEPR
ncbi:phytoene desaturase family protein [Acidianus sp. HS-5]|uniref:phytoene desaturase family protein n=1 Tax=Acidianus sp. HS-5 TaxID=2886040 RepID=UPI001F01472E|nr:phytoene desaturase family protein [Acidianus sp. HS-5]BDC17341.1 phytoene dehydrogenase [Acidianus sp. HS-5]